MTKEEAIFCEQSYLGETNCIDCNYYGTDSCKSRESHRMAIEALKQEPCEDCISREKALELAENSHRLAETMEDLAWLHENNLKALPSVQPKQESVIHAKWERHYTRPNVYADSFWHCSNCNFKTMSVNADKYYKYCPNCGAKMDKE